MIITANNGSIDRHSIQMHCHSIDSFLLKSLSEYVYKEYSDSLLLLFVSLSSQESHESLHWSPILPYVWHCVYVCMSCVCCAPPDNAFVSAEPVLSQMWVNRYTMGPFHTHWDPFKALCLHFRIKFSYFVNINRRMRSSFWNAIVFEYIKIMFSEAITILRSPGWLLAITRIIIWWT